MFNKFTGDAEIEILIDEKRKKSWYRDKSGEIFKLPTFYDKENVTGKVIIALNNTKKLDHIGIKIEVIGSIGKIQYLLLKKIILVRKKVVQHLFL